MSVLTRLTSKGATSQIPPSSPKASFQRIQRCIAAFLWPSSAVAVKSSKTDAIDCFTNDLVQRKNKEWADLREKLIAGKKKRSPGALQAQVELVTRGVMNDIATLKSPELGLDIRSLSQAQLDNLLLATLEIKNKVDFLYLIRQIIQWSELPSKAVLVSCLKYLSSNGSLQDIQALAELCSEHEVGKIYAGLAPFKAIALWTNGNADAALATLHLGYGDCLASDEGRRMVRVAFRNIAEETLAEKSQAVLVALMNVARAIHEEHKDIFILACIWKNCFASAHLCDQQTATGLLKEYEELRELVARRAAPLCSSFLNRNKVVEVYRLIEIFLLYKQKSACNICLGLLFDYQYLRQDLSACAEIVRTCNELDMPLSSHQTEQFLTLFIDQNDRDSKPRVPARPTTFQYKF